MTETYFRRDSHYVPCEYLKRWTSSSRRLWVYRILVSHENVLYGSRVPFEELLTTRTYLYTRIAAGLESDEIEHWFGHEYETPAEEALQKATSNGRLTPSDWRVLVRFLAAQDVRTPARLLETLERWRKTLPDLLKNTLQASVQKFEVMKSRGENIPPTESPLTKYFPLRIISKHFENLQILEPKPKGQSHPVLPLLSYSPIIHS